LVVSEGVIERVPENLVLRPRMVVFKVARVEARVVRLASQKVPVASGRKKAVKPPAGGLFALRVSDVRMPQVEPPPPLRAQKRSVFYFEFATVRFPSAVTISTSRSWSTPSPLDGAKGP
jgi:hypothetical protein